VNNAPYAGGWLFKLKIDDRAELAKLLDAAAYRRAAGAP
jgi:glycine cleavage system H lipoate-binding protein